MRRSAMNNSRRRICVASDFPPPQGGLGLQAQLLVRGLRREGVLVKVVDRRVRFRGALGWVNEVNGNRAMVRVAAYTWKLAVTIPTVDVVHEMRLRRTTQIGVCPHG